MSFRRFPVRFGRYLLLDRIAAGGMAEVYRAKVTGVEAFQRLLAIKTMLPTLTESENFVRMFIDEAKVASQLNHPNIIQIHELGRLDDVLFIAMELISGHDVGHILRVARAVGKPPPLTFSAYVVAKAAEGLDFAHHKTDPAGRPLNLVHRDVSPQNILVSYDGEVKVGDFGIAKSDSREVKTAGGIVKGKIPYMAPEQVAGGRLDGRTDVFALGTVFYQLLTGQRLFQGANQFDLMAAVRDAQVPPVAFRYPHVPEAMEAVLRRALAQRPEDRYPTADELAQALASFLIDGGTLYGARQAALYMDGLFHDEVGSTVEAQRRYASMTDADCSQNEVEPQRTELYQTAFDRPLEIARPRVAPPPPPPPPSAFSDDLAGPTVAIEVPIAARPTLRGLKLPALTPRLVLLVFGTTLLVTVLAAILIPGPNDEPRDAPTPVLALAEPRPADPQPAPTTTVPAPQAPPAAPTPAKPQRPTPASQHFGFVSMRADGATAARIFIDGADVGYSPIIMVKVPVGRHKVRIIEQTQNGPGRMKSLEIVVSAKHTTQDPLRLVVPL